MESYGQLIQFSQAGLLHTLTILNIPTLYNKGKLNWVEIRVDWENFRALCSVSYLKCQGFYAHLQDLSGTRTSSNETGSCSEIRRRMPTDSPILPWRWHPHGPAGSCWWWCRGIGKPVKAVPRTAGGIGAHGLCGFYVVFVMFVPKEGHAACPMPFRAGGRFVFLCSLMS